MKKRMLAIIFLTSLLISAIAFTVGASGTTVALAGADAPLMLWYDEEVPIFDSEHKPNVPNGTHQVDEAWEKYSLPIGNGFVGANVFGRTETERIQISEKTLQNPYEVKDKNGKKYTVGGTNSFSETFIDFGHKNVSDYVRYLDLKTAISGVEYTSGGVKYTREYFASYPDRVLVIRLDADTAGALNFTLRPTIPYEQSYGGFAGDGITKEGTVTSKVNNGVGEIELSGNMGYYGVDFLGIYKVYTDGGSVTASTVQHTYNDTDGTAKSDTDGTIVVSGAKSAYIVVTIGTDYELSEDIFTSSETDKPTKKTTLEDARANVNEYIAKWNKTVEGKSYDAAYKALKDAHVADHSELFGRVTLDLNCKESDFNTPTDDLLTNYKNTGSTYLETLMFQYGRYLLIASSREGSLPAHLQGVWNTYEVPAWASDYTHNINVEMNYWPAFSTNIAETFLAYVSYNNAYMKQAEIFADKLIQENNPGSLDKDGGNGWVVGDHTSPYKYTGHKSAGNLGFMTQVFWEYYAYTQDPVVLQHVYDILVNAARYITKCVEQDGNGNYLIPGSDSPEMFVNGIWYYTVGTTYAQSFAYLNNYNALEAAKALGIDLSNKNLLSTEEYSILSTIMEQIDKYDPIVVGLSGQIKEFREETYYCSLGDEYDHRHIAQLVGLYPGNLINGNTPAWIDASKVTLNERGDGGTGWGVANKINMWARAKDGNKAHVLLSNLIKNNTTANLWTFHPPFQIDASFGTTAGISEMLLQSHEGYISPLAAIPDNWSTGSYTGLVARGNFEIGAAWNNGVATAFTVKSGSGLDASIYYPTITGARVVDSKGNTVSFTVSGKDIITFDTEVGETYTISGFTAREKIAKPTNLNGGYSAEDEYNFSWTAVSGADSYNVYVAVESAPTYTLIANVKSASYTYTIPEADIGKRMTFAVTAVKGDSESERALTYNNNPFTTEYGDIPGEYVGYPVAVFKKAKGASSYTFHGSYTSFIDGMNAAKDLLHLSSGSIKGGTVALYITRDFKAKGDSFNAVSQLDGTVIVDLGGHRLNSGVNRLIGMEAKKENGRIDNTADITVKNGTIYTMVGKPIAELWSASQFVYEGTKNFKLTFDKIEFKKLDGTGTTPIFKSRAEFTDTKKAYLDLTFNNCTFDFSKETKAVTVIDSSDAGANGVCNVKINGGVFNISLPTIVTTYKGSANDTITSTATIKEFGEDALSTPYGSVPKSQLTSDKNFAVFGKKPGDSSYTFIATYGSYKNGAFNNARDQIKRGTGAYAGGEVVIYMVKDYNSSGEEAFNRAMQIDGTLVLDLGGKTFTVNTPRLIGFELGSGDIINGYDYVSGFTLRNGTIVGGSTADKVFRSVVEIWDGTQAQSGTKAVKVCFEGVNFKASGDGKWNIITVRDFNTDAKKVKVDIKYDNCTFDCPGVTNLGILNDTSVNNRATVTMDVVGGRSTAFGNVPAIDKTFVVFCDGKASYALNTYYATWEHLNALMIINSGKYRGKTLGLYMTKDYVFTDNTYANLAQIDGTVIMDLGGNKITHKYLTMFDAVGKAFNGTYKATNIVIRNGYMLSTDSPFIKFSSGGTSGNFGVLGTKEYSFTFENVVFDKDPSAPGYAYIAWTEGFDAVTNGNQSKNIKFTATFNNCNFSSKTSALFDFNNTPYIDADIRINGGNMRVYSYDFIILKTDDATDKYTLGTYNGEYMTLTMPYGAEAPKVTFAGGTLEFVKAYDTMETAHFKIEKSGLSTYVPKHTLTLDSTLVMNVYVPVKKTLSFVFDGVEYTDLSKLAKSKVTLDDGEEYYKLSIDLPAHKAAGDVNLTVTVENGDESAKGIFNLSVPRYVKRALDTADSVELQVLRDVLVYVKAAYAYFDKSNTAVPEIINSIIGASYEKNNTVTVEGSTVAPTEGLMGVTFSITATPSWIFFLDIAEETEAEKYTFSVNSSEKPFKVGINDGKYFARVPVSAYEMADAITYSIDGVEKGSYHIASYHEFAKGENDPALVELVERFWKYCQSARDYKNSFTVSVNYIDGGGNKLSESDTLRVFVGKKIKLMAPIVEGYYTRDVYFSTTVTDNSDINIVYRPIPVSADDATARENIKDIVSWGDSITNGAGSNHTAVEQDYGIDLEALGSQAGGLNYVDTLKKIIAGRLYSGIDIANNGVGGETSAMIASRADTENYYVKVTADTTVSSGSVVLPIGYNKAETGRQGILRKDSNWATENVRIVGKDANNNDVTVTGTLVCSLTSDAPKGSQLYNVEAKYLEYTFTRTDGKTNAVTFKAGTRVVTESSIIYDGRTTIIFMGTNGGYTSADDLVNQMAEMIKAQGNPEYFLVVTTHMGTTESRKELYDKMYARFGDNYINTGTELNCREAYEFAGFKESDIVAIDSYIAEGRLTELLIKDTCHPNSVGYAVLANVFFERLWELGAFDDLLDYYDSFYS